MIGQRLLDRYELLEEGPRALGGRLFCARDLAFRNIVAVKQLGSATLGGPAVRVLEAQVRRVQCFSHPLLLRHHSLELPEGLLVRDWVHGFSLLDLLKRRRELSCDFALRLLDALPAGFDFIAKHDLSLPRPLLGKLLFHFEERVAIEEISALPIDRWPPFALKLNPISIRASASDDETEATMTTVSDLRTVMDDGPVNAPARLAELLYEALGGPQRNSRRYTPLPALHEEGNGVLRRALLESPYADCRSLWADLALAEPSDLRPLTPPPTARPTKDRTWHIPAALLGLAEPATLLKLVPQNPAHPPIHLVARPSFRLGRSLFHADFVARFLPETPSNKDLTNQLSRVHALAEASGGRLTIRDGNGDAPSVNGTTIDDQALESDPPAPLDRRVLLTLGGVYPLELVPFVTRGPASLKISNPIDAGPAAKPGEFSGAVFCLPAHRQPPVRHAVWLFSRAGFGIDAATRIVWDLRGGEESPAAFFHDRGNFWIGNLTLPPGVLDLAGTALGPEEIAPLRHGQTLHLGPLPFTVDLA